MTIQQGDYVRDKSDTYDNVYRVLSLGYKDLALCRLVRNGREYVRDTHEMYRKITNLRHTD